MIYDKDNIKVLKFGKADICVHPGIIAEPEELKGYAGIFFSTIEPVEKIGDVISITKVGLPEVIVAFNKVESIDVVIEALQKIKEDLIISQIKLDDETYID